MIPLRILYFGTFDKPYDTEVYISNTLEAMGVNVVRQETARTSYEQLIALLTQNWDCVLFSKGWFPCGDEALIRNTIKAYRGLTIGWFWDLCWNTPRELLVFNHHLFHTKIVFTSDGGNQQKWENLGIDHRVLRQGIYGPESFIGKPEEKYAHDIVFVGSLVHRQAFGWEHREQLVHWLQGVYGERFHLYPESDSQEIRNTELNRLYASAKIVVGDSVASPNYWSNRLYETIGRGGFLIFPEIEGLEQEFTPYKDFIPYRIGDWEGLKEKIDFYLKQPEKREEIKRHGLMTCQARHTYQQRCSVLLDTIKDWNEKRLSAV